MNPSFGGLLRAKLESQERDLGRKLTLEEQNVLKAEAMREAFEGASQLVALRDSALVDPE